MTFAVTCAWPGSRIRPTAYPPGIRAPGARRQHHGPQGARRPWPSRTSTDYVSSMELPEIEQRLQELVASIPEPGRAEILRILTIRDDAERAREIGHLHHSGVLPQTAGLLI